MRRISYAAPAAQRPSVGFASGSAPWVSTFQAALGATKAKVDLKPSRYGPAEVCPGGRGKATSVKAGLVFTLPTASLQLAAAASTAPRPVDGAG